MRVKLNRSEEKVANYLNEFFKLKLFEFTPVKEHCVKHVVTPCVRAM